MDTRGKRNQPVQYVPAAGPQKGPKKRHSTEGNTPAAGPQKGPPKRHSTEGNTPAAGEQKGPPKRHSSEGHTPAAGPQKPKKNKKKQKHPEKRKVEPFTSGSASTKDWHGALYEASLAG